MVDPTTQSVETNIVFSKDAASVTLRNPEFGDSQIIEAQRVLNVSRGGSLNVFRENTWPKETQYNMTVTELTRAEVDDYFTFVKDTLGQQVTLVDYEGRSFEGVILNPQVEAVQSRATCGWEIPIQFVGTLVGE